MSRAAPAPLLSGAHNFRAVRPYKTADGRMLRANNIYRSGELSRLSDTDLGIIAGLNIHLVCDLRTGREQSEFVSRWPEAPAHVKLDLPDRHESDSGPHKIFELIASHQGEAGGVLAMDMLYRRKPKAFARSLQILFQTILGGNGLPLLVHCHAGKDRTGFVVAMLLAAAGVNREDIIEDYIISSHYFLAEKEVLALATWAKRSFGQEIHPASARPMVDTRLDYIEAALQEIDAGWGSVDGYLRDAVGLTGLDREAVQNLLTS
ncbi:MAG: tyrosine-protein phosphatase [Acidocella sp.]|nr:tyrosine-protein phosphatase [Acidocella sp.]